MADNKAFVSRKEARAGGMCLVFSYEFHGGDHRAYCKEVMEYDPEYYNDYSELLFLTCFDNRGEIDSKIEKHTKGWKVSRLSRVTAAILRVAVCEIFYIEEVDKAVAINEAVELAKDYENEESASFINGVLGGIVRDIEYA